MFLRIRQHLTFAWRVLSSSRTFDEEVCRAVAAAFAERDEQRLIDLHQQLKLTDEMRSELLRPLMAGRRHAAERWWAQMPPRRTPAPTVIPRSFDAMLEQLRLMHPRLYPTWHRLNFQVGPDAYALKPETSCSTGKRATDEPFSGFVASYLQGDVLDIGCGPYDVPVYLKGYPLDRIAAIDPVEPFQPHPFVFARGLAEFLPFADRSFDTVIAATSLDHVLSLDRALSEIARVIKPSGSLIVWDGFVKGSPRYDPAQPDLAPVDEFHFFHFDEGWFEQAMADHGFSVREKLPFDPSPHAPQYCISYFYCLKARD